MRDLCLDCSHWQLEQRLPQSVSHVIPDAVPHLCVVPNIRQSFDGVFEQGFIQGRQYNACLAVLERKRVEVANITVSVVHGELDCSFAPEQPQFQNTQRIADGLVVL
ncbi:hypothetical protein SDC9_169655 [bioreactor metagenome]|uniref:Uncharacterized protein n=1 Tax=bioreactor metagenome TaxID=1076179 RepID=A0A645G8H5_9ZZZZ